MHALKGKSKSDGPTPDPRIGLFLNFENFLECPDPKNKDRELFTCAVSGDRRDRPVEAVGEEPEIHEREEEPGHTVAASMASPNVCFGDTCGGGRGPCHGRRAGFDEACLTIVLRIFAAMDPSTIGT